MASHYLTELLTSHQFHEEAISKDGERYRKYADNPIKHPLATKDKGFYSVDCRTDLSALEPNEIAKMLLNVNDHSTNSFIQQIRRYISSLERPLTTLVVIRRAIFTLTSIRSMLNLRLQF